MVKLKVLMMSLTMALMVALSAGPAFAQSDGQQQQQQQGGGCCGPTIVTVTTIAPTQQNFVFAPFVIRTF